MPSRPLALLRNVRRPRPIQRVIGIVRSEAAPIKQGLVANLISSSGDLLAGIVLGAATGTLEAVPGLLVLIPPAIGMRGNIFGALGSRMGTSLRTGQFSMKLGRGTLLGENLVATTVITFAVSCALAPIARIVSAAFGAESIGTLELAVVSVVGGVLSSVFVLAITMGVAALAARREWDLDTVSAPMVTAAGDMVTLPCLILATLLLDIPYFTQALGALLLGCGVVAIGYAYRSKARLARRIVFESLPTLLVAALISSVAGLVVEKRLEAFVALPALLILLPPFLENSGSLGSMMSARISSKLHTGLISPRAFPAEAVPDVVIQYILAMPVYLATGVSAHFGSVLIGAGSPGLVAMIQITLIAGLIVTTLAMAVAYYGAVGSFRWGLDPDNHGVPLVTSAMDVLASNVLVLTVVTLGFVQ